VHQVGDQTKVKFRMSRCRGKYPGKLFFFGLRIVEDGIDMIWYIFVNCNWVVTRWQ